MFAPGNFGGAVKSINNNKLFNKPQQDGKLSLPTRGSGYSLPNEGSSPHSINPSIMSNANASRGFPPGFERIIQMLQGLNPGGNQMMNQGMGNPGMMNQNSPMMPSQSLLQRLMQSGMMLR